MTDEIAYVLLDFAGELLVRANRIDREHTFEHSDGSMEVSGNDAAIALREVSEAIRRIVAKGRL